MKKRKTLKKNMKKARSISKRRKTVTIQKTQQQQSNGTTRLTTVQRKLGAQQKLPKTLNLKHVD